MLLVVVTLVCALLLLRLILEDYLDGGVSAKFIDNLCENVEGRFNARSAAALARRKNS